MKLKNYTIEKYVYFEWGNQFCLIPTILIDNYAGDIEFSFQFLFLTINIAYMFNPKY